MHLYLSVMFFMRDCIVFSDVDGYFNINSWHPVKKIFSGTAALNAVAHSWIAISLNVAPFRISVRLARKLIQGGECDKPFFCSSVNGSTGDRAKSSDISLRKTCIKFDNTSFLLTSGIDNGFISLHISSYSD